MEHHTDIWHMLGFLGVIVVVLLKDRIQMQPRDKELFAQVKALEVRMIAQENRRIPPDWFEARVGKLEEAITDLTKSCIAHQQRE